MPEAPPHFLTSRIEQGVLVLTVTKSQIEGIEVSQPLQQELLEAVEAAQANLVVVDLHNVRYVSSVAFSPLLNLRRKLQAAGGRLVVCGLSAMVGDVFYTTRMVSADGSFVAPFEMQPDAAAAVAFLTRPIEDSPAS
jgi:anti-anti-sigma factor